MNRAFATLLAGLFACAPALTPTQEKATGAPSSAPPASAAPAPPPIASASPPAVEPPLPVPGPPEITLLDPGVEPPRAMRYAFSKKPERMIVEATTRAGDAAPSSGDVALRIVVELKPTAVDADGTLTESFSVVTIEIVGASLDAEMKKLMNEQLKPAEGIKGTAVVTSRGIAKSIDVSAPANASETVARAGDSVREAIRTMTTPFPEEPIGANARWQVKTVMAVPMTLVETATYTLKAAKGSACEVEARRRRSSKPRRGAHRSASCRSVRWARDRRACRSIARRLRRARTSTPKRRWSFLRGDEADPIRVKNRVDMKVSPGR